MAGYGLDDSDFDEYLETSSEEEELAAFDPLPQQASAIQGLHAPSQIFLTGTSYRGPRCGVSQDACTEVPPSR